MMSKIKSLLYPVLQRARYAGFAAKFEKAKKLPMNDKKILMYSSSKGKLGGNLLAIKNYIENNNLDYEIKAVTSVEPMPQNELAAEMAQSKFILVDDYEPLVYVLRLRQGQRLVQVWHAMGAFKRFGYGRKTAEKNSITHRNYTDAIVSSPQIVPVYAQAFGIDESRVKAIGSPRTDCFFDRAHISCAKERLYKKEPRLKGKKICLFAPTFRGENVHNAYYPAEFFNAEDFINALPENWALIIKMHPFIKEKLPVSDNIKSRVFDFSDEREINDILFITDVLVTDYSSVIFENAVIGNPAVLYAPDLSEYDGGRGFYYDYADYSCGEVVSDFESLAPAVLRARRGNEKLEDFKKRFVSLCDGKACERFVYEILK